jgi:hypothetical protein
MNQNALAAALRKKFTRPRQVLRALGFDSADITEVMEDSNMRTTRRARDDENPIDAETVMQFIDDALEGMPESEVEHLADQLESRLLSDDPAAADRRRARRAEDARAGRRSRRRLGRDEPPEFEGRPRPGGGQDPLAAAQDRVASRRQLAGDSAGVVPTFEELFPSTRNVGRGFVSGRGTVML